MTETNPLDPEVLDLLDEIAADPDSTLLRVPREPLRRFLPLREGPVSAREPMLTRAEKHLVRAHREYVAELLIDACRLSLTRDPINKTRIHRWVSNHEPLEMPSEGRWRRWVSRDLSTECIDVELTSSRDLLASCARTKRPPASELAGASLRLLPRDETRIWLGVALHREGQPKSAQITLHNVLAHRPTPLNEMWARVDCGLIAFSQSDYHGAVEWYRSAASVQAMAIPLLTWFTSALQVGSKSEARRAALHLDGQHILGLPVYEEFLAALQGVDLTSVCADLVSEIYDSLSPTTKGIADALLP